MSASDYPKIYLYRRVVLAKLFIDEHYAGKIVLADIADEAFFSKFHFIRLFKKIYGRTPHQYLKCVRIERSMQLLRAGASVTEACYDVGFESIGSFSTLFSRVVGLAPSAYSLQQRREAAHMLNAPLEFIPGCFAEKKGWIRNDNFEEMVS